MILAVFLFVICSLHNSEVCLVLIYGWLCFWTWRVLNLIKHSFNICWDEFLFLVLQMGFMTLIDLRILWTTLVSLAQISLDRSIWSFYMLLVLACWYFVENFCFCTIKDIGLWFSFCVFVWFQYQIDVSLIKRFRQSFTLFDSFE